MAWEVLESTASRMQRTIDEVRDTVRSGCHSTLSFDMRSSRSLTE